MAAKQQKRSLAGRLAQEKDLFDEKRIEKENRTLQQKLAAIRREPPSAVHAPNGSLSLKNNKAPTTPAPRPIASWPTQIAPPGARKKREEGKRIAHENAVLQRKMADQYKPNRASEIVKMGWGQPVDGMALWQKRLTLYDDPQPKLSTATQVPKDLTCAICRGCGRKSFYLADGNPVREHKIVKGAFYCSATCMEVDEVSLRAEVNFAVKGVWNPTRPPQESWVVNPAHVLERKLLRRNTNPVGPGQRPLSTEEIKAKALEVRRKDAARAAEMKQRLEKAMQPGYDGERPCCWKGPTY